MNLDTQPYMLYETVGMLVKYVNKQSFLSLEGALNRLYRDCLDDAWHARAQRLQKIMEEVCGEVNRDDPDLQYFFARRIPGDSRNPTTLARVMTLPFLCFQEHSLEAEARVLKDTWRNMVRRGVRLDHGLAGLSFHPAPVGKKVSGIFQQIYGLGFDGDFAMELVNVFTDFDTKMDQLTALIKPYAERLEAALNADRWMMDSLGAYWEKQFQTTSPEAFVSGSQVDRTPPPSSRNRRVCFSLMDATESHCRLPSDGWKDDESLFVFGSMLVVECSQRMYSEDLEGVCAALRVLGDKSKLDLLLRLAEGRSYCQQLAEESRCNSGNMSRNLAALSACGFLRQEREQARTYYTTDIQAIEGLFAGVIDLLKRRGQSRS